MNKRLRIAVLMGGRSPEYEISLTSGRKVVKNLDPRKYEVIPVTISKDGQTFQMKGKNYPLSQLSSVNCQLFFIAMHGPFGEDGTIQGFLELIGVLYTGSGVLASALGMDKISSRKLFTQAGLSVPQWMIISRNTNPQSVWSNFTPPIFVKPSNQGSSIGASLVKRKQDLKKALKLAFGFSRYALVEEYLGGIEVTGSILGNDRPTALPLVEIVPKKDFFSYEAKYDQRLCEEIVPARINKILTKKAQNAAVTAYQTLGCRGFGRVDMIIKDNRVYVLEVNTIPGLTPVSLFPKAAQAAGISYPALLDKIIQFALESR